MRDQIKDSNYFDMYIASQTERINKFQTKIRSGEIVQERLPSVCSKINDIRFEIVVAKYSSGEEPRDIKADFESVWKGWEHFQLTTYSKAVWMISMAVMLGIDKDDIRKKEELYSNHNGYDWLIKYLSLCDKDGGKSISDALYMKKVYETLRDMVMSETVDQKNMKEYLLRWYQRHASAGWHNSHKSKENTYCGYWAFEAGAIAKIQGMEDDLLKDHKYYPYDLVHF